MKSNKIVICVFLLTLFSAFCGCTRDWAPAVPEEYWDYFPYEAGDDLVFSNGTEEMTFEVSEKYINKKEGWVYGKHGQYTEMWFAARNASHSLDMKAKISVWIHISHAKYSASMGEHSTSVDYRYNFELRKESGFNPPSVIVFTSPMEGDIKDCSVYVERMVLEDGKGIVSFYDARSNIEWRLKEIIK